MGDAYSRPEALGLRLIPAGAPVGNFLPGVQVGNLLFLAGQGGRVTMTARSKRAGWVKI